MLPDIDCVGCGACANACPKNCLNMVEATGIECDKALIITYYKVV